MSPSRFRRVAAVLCILWDLCACGGESPAAPATPAPTPLAPATLADLSAAVTSPDSGRQLNCRDDVHAQLALTNRAARSVVVTGVRKTHSVLSGGCSSVPDFTYGTAPRLVVANSTSVVFNRALYRRGSGCCVDPSRCGGTCEIQETFDVVTGIGSVQAGRLTYSVNFRNCEACGAAAGAQAYAPVP